MAGASVELVETITPQGPCGFGLDGLDQRRTDRVASIPAMAED